MVTTLRTLLLIAAFVAAGCASSPAPRYYRLLAEAVPAPATDGPAVIVGPFQLAEYLARPQIVSLGGGNRVAIDDYERWAEPLDANFQSVVAANVGRLLGSDRVLEFPAQTILKDARRVSGRVIRFDVDAAGEAVLEVQWGITDATGGVRERGRVSRHTTRAANDTTDARIAALNATVGDFSAELAAALRGTPSPGESTTP
jgi:uncharacterized lipoprotein YmbA